MWQPLIDNGYSSQWFQEALAMLNMFGLRWKITINLSDKHAGYWSVHIDNGVVEFPAFSLALKYFLDRLEDRLIKYVKPVEYRD